MKKQKNQSLTKKTESQNYWQSYSDMMAALLLMFILIMAAILFQSSRSYQDSYQSLEEQREEMKKQEKTIEGQRKEIEEQRKEIEDVREQLDKLENLVGVKSEIVEALSEEFKSTSLTIHIDPKTGDITFDSSILFDYNESDLKDEGKKYLTSFIPKYISVLLGDRFKDSIAEIIVEGHTDTEGDYIYNLNLSQRRAYEVAAFCIDTKTSMLEKDQIEALRKILTANGKSFSNPVMKDKKIDMAASRRVVFKFRLKDEEMIDQMQQILGK